MSGNLLVVSNPLSGSGKSTSLAKEFSRVAEDAGFHPILIDIVGIEAMLRECVTQLNSEKFLGLVSVGGDGLLHELLPLIKQYGLPFTVVPAGTGNDFSRAIGTNGYSKNELVKLITQEPTHIDSFTVQSDAKIVSACQVLSLGFDALVNERANSFHRIRGKIKYVAALLRELPLFKPLDFSITIDGVVYHRTAMLIAIANGPSYGGGMRICPTANNSDGVLDLLVLNRVSIFELLKVFPRVYSGSHISHPAIELFQGKRIVVDAKAKGFADGEFVGNLPLTITVDPGSLEVWK